MLRRLVLATGALLTALFVYAASSQWRAPWPSLALAGVGERAYAVRLKHLPVGQLVQHASREPEGNYRFSSQLEFQLAQGQPVRVFESKLFSGLPPFALLSAQQQDTTASTTSQVKLTRAMDGTYEAEVTRGPNIQRKTLRLQHALSDYLAVEQWLPTAKPDTPASFSSIDFDSMSLRHDNWTLLARTEKGYEVTKSSPLEATRLFLDSNFKPLRFSMAGTFEIEIVDPNDLPISPEPVFHSETYQVPLNKPIEHHQSVRALTLQVQGNTELVSHWENATQEDGAILLRASAGSGRLSQHDDNARYSREELSYPLRAAAVEELAKLASEPQASARQQAEQLTHFVHNYIEYDHHSTMQNVLDVINSQQGDCNEYAELFTTLGRALGLPVRTVIGLAYTNDNSPAFGLHAWNEVLLEERWVAFDPTWDQVSVDATHLPLPNEAGGLLLGITSLDELRFKVRSLSY